MKISSKLYDILKILCPVLGALSALYVALADVWSLPFATQVSGTIGAVIAFLGSIMQISSKTYWNEQRPLQGSDIDNIEDGGLG